MSQEFYRIKEIRLQIGYFEGVNFFFDDTLKNSFRMVILLTFTDYFYSN